MRLRLVRPYYMGHREKERLFARTKFTDAFWNPKYGFFFVRIFCLRINEFQSRFFPISTFIRNFFHFTSVKLTDFFFCGIVMYTKHIARFPYPCLSSLNRPLNASKNNNTIMCHNARKRNVRNFQRIRKKTIDKLTTKCLPFIRNNALNKPLRWHSGTEKKERNTTVDRRPFTQKHQLSFLFLCMYFYLQLRLLCLVRWLFFPHFSITSDFVKHWEFSRSSRTFCLQLQAKQKSIRVHFTSKTVRIEHALSCVSIERTHTTASFQCRVQLVQSALCERVWCKQ